MELNLNLTHRWWLAFSLTTYYKLHKLELPWAWEPAASSRALRSCEG